MTASVVRPVIPQSGALQRQAGTDRLGRTLPLPPMPSRDPDGLTVYGVATLDCNGRLADATVLAALGWEVGTCLDIQVKVGLVLIAAHPHAVFRVTRPGQVRLPAGVRDWCGLAAGHRVLLTADLRAGLLVVHPPAILATMVGQFHAAVLGGDAG